VLKRTRASVAPGEPRRVAYAYLALPLLAYATFVLLPIATTVSWSFLDWDGVTQQEWVGFDNYLELLDDRLLRIALSNAFVLVFFYTALPVAIGLLLASLLSRVTGRRQGVYRAVLFLPQVLAAVVVALVFKLLYEPNVGVLNSLLRALGLDGFARPWLGDFDLALPAIGVVGSWVFYGLCMVLFLAGIQRIPTDQYDAARVDGAGPVAEFFAVTLPGLRHEITVAVVITTIAALRNFDLVFNLTRGGPGDATTVPVLEVYRRAFLYGEVGSASALAVAMAVMILLVTVIVVVLQERRA
jgi:raffinose/stachyose/melibiose transport system permease protein